MQLITQLVNRAAEAGQTEVQVYRFPNELCSDRGRRINNTEPEWEKTLEGRPKAAYEFWHDHLRPLGFGLKAEVLVARSPPSTPGLGAERPSARRGAIRNGEDTKSCVVKSDDDVESTTCKRIR
jgi:hypothetical protein